MSICCSLDVSSDANIDPGSSQLHALNVVHRYLHFLVTVRIRRDSLREISQQSSRCRDLRVSSPDREQASSPREEHPHWSSTRA